MRHTHRPPTPSPRALPTPRRAGARIRAAAAPASLPPPTAWDAATVARLLNASAAAGLSVEGKKGGEAAPLPPTVHLVGTGPGDPGLLTLRAASLLAGADVILYDRLVSPEILALANPGARMVYVGKSAGLHTRPQPEIHALLAAFATADAGSVVVRLKGGDPFVFGRGGEEAAALRAAGVAVRVVPGVTAAAGVAADLAIPTTHRGAATAVTYVTGHAREGGEGEAEAAVRAAAQDTKTTLVVYMGLATLPVLAADLIAAGRPADTPAVAVERGTTPSARAVFARLQDLPAAVAAAGLESPTLLMVGEVVGLCPGWEAAGGGAVVQEGAAAVGA